MNRHGPMSAPISRQLPLLAALLAVLLWAFAFPASKAVLPYFSVAQVVLLRYLVACIFYAVLFLSGRFSLPQWREVPPMLLLGGLGITVYQLLFVHGVGRVAAGAAAMIIATTPVFAALLARLFLREKLSAIAWGGICLSLFGVGIISARKSGHGELLGYGMLIVAVLAMAIYFVFQKPFFARYSPLSMIAYTSFAGTLPLLYLLPQAIPPVLAAPPTALLCIAAMGVFSSGLGFLLWFYALSKLPVATVTSFLFLQPVLVTIMAWFWLHELPSPQGFLGGAVALLGVTFILLPPKFYQRNRRRRQ